MPLGGKADTIKKLDAVTQRWPNTGPISTTLDQIELTLTCYVMALDYASLSSPCLHLTH